MIVLDTSVVVKWFSNEKHTEKALDIRKRIRNKDEIGVFPDLLLYELSNALRYNPNFDEKDVIDALESIINMDMEIVNLSSEVINLSITLAFERDITIYDSSYVALAQKLDANFVTADEKLYNKIHDLGLSTYITDI